MQKLNMDLLRRNIEEAAQYDLARHKIFGAAYWVFQERQAPCEMCFGTVSPGSGAPVTPKTIFRIASMTKPITAVAILLLAERGLLSLDDPISRYLPLFKGLPIMEAEQGVLRCVGESRADPTIRQVLSHTAGIGSNMDKRQMMNREDKASLNATLRFLSKVGLDFEPGSKQQYNSVFGFDVLGKIIEIVAGEDLQCLLKREVLDPCGMKDTSFTPSCEQWGRMISQHNQINGESVAEQTEPGCVFGDVPATHYLAGAGLISTLDDYAAFAKMLLHEGCLDGEQVIPCNVISQMRVPQLSKDIMPGNECWGLGVRIITDKDYPTLPVGAYGWFGAYGSRFWVDPANRIAAVYMKNSLVDGGSHSQSARSFENAVHRSLE